MHKASYTLPPPVHLRERASRLLKLLPITAFLAAGFAPQAWADSGGKKLTLGSDNWYIGCGAAFPCPGSGNKDAKAVTVDSNGTHERVAGGYSNTSGDATVVDTSGTVENNELTIASGGLVSLAHGGHAIWTDTLAHKNTLTIKGTVNDKAYGGLSQQGAATYNQVTLAAGGKAGNVYGGWAYTDATHNEVTIESGSTGNPYVTGGYASSGNATYNTVTISGGTVVSVLGGQGTNATHNTVTLSGGTVSYVNGGMSSGDANHNTVTLAGGTVTGTVQGGWGSTSGDDVTDNTLEVKHEGSSAGGVYNFDTLDFTLPADIADGGKMLTVPNVASFADGGSNYPVTVKLAFDDAPTALNKGESVKLITAGILDIVLANTTATATTAGGNYEFEVKQVGNDLIAELKKVTYAITATATPAAGGGIDCDPTSVEAGSGKTVTCMLSVNEGYEVSSFSVSGDVDQSGCGSPCVLKDIASNVDVSVEFVKVHKVEEGTSTGGKVTCELATVADGTGSTICTAEAEADSGFTFVDGSMSVSGPGTLTECSGNKCTLTNVTGDVTVSAKFTNGGGGGGSFALGVVSIDGDTGNTNLLQPGKPNEVLFTLGASFAGSGTLEITNVTKALQKASLDKNTVDISDGKFTANITPEAGEKTVTVTLTVKDITMDKNTYTFTVASGGGGGPSPVPTLGEVGLLLSGIALAGAAAPALRRREKQGKKADTHQ